MDEKTELYTLADFLANCGGLLGVFCGFSVLSLFEIVFYATLRLFWRVRDLLSEEDNSSSSNQEAPVNDNNNSSNNAGDLELISIASFENFP